MKRVLAFGAGNNLAGAIETMAAGKEIVAVLDNDIHKQGKYTDEIGVLNQHIKIAPRPNRFIWF